MRRRLFWTCLLLLPLAAGHALYWRWATQQLRAGFDHWVARQQADGWIVRAGPPKTGGWPWAATLTVPETLLQQGGPGGLLWESERVILRVELHSPAILHLRAEGAQKGRIGDIPDTPFSADRLRVSLPLDPHAPAWVGIQIDGLRAKLPAEDGTQDVGIGGLVVRADVRTAAIALSIQAKAVTMPRHFAPAIGGVIDELAVNATLRGPPPFAASPIQAARLWRAAGSTLEMSHLDLRAGSFVLAGSASVTLDAQLQPAAAGTVRISGYATMLDGLVASRLLDGRTAIAAKAMLGLMARPGPNGEPATVEVPVGLQDRTVSLHTFAILRLPVLAWPGG